MTRVAVGGTFDPLHDGHKALLMKAVDLGRDGELLIGLTSDEMAKNKIHEVDDYRSRYNEVMKFIHDQGVIPRIVKLDDPYGPVSYTHLRAHETRHDLVCRLLLEKKKKKEIKKNKKKKNKTHQKNKKEKSTTIK